MSTIKIHEAVLDVTPTEFKNLPADATYKLTKTGSKLYNFYVSDGDTMTGSLQIVNVKELGLPGVKVNSRNYTDYIRTSPIVKVLDATSDTITFETEGGFYKLEKLPYEA